uniref:NADH dehydrogenase subunit 6 n=1 Tax=Parascaris equorum TaxID=6256 RepID=A0A914RFC8_PAREQ
MQSSQQLVSKQLFQVFIILFLIIVALVVFLLMLFGAYSATETLGFMIIATYLLVAVLEVFFLFIVYRLYQ